MLPESTTPPAVQKRFRHGTSDWQNNSTWRFLLPRQAQVPVEVDFVLGRGTQDRAKAPKRSGAASCWSEECRSNCDPRTSTPNPESAAILELQASRFSYSFAQGT